MEKVELITRGKQLNIEDAKKIEKRYLQIISMLVQIIFVFFSVFFSVYVYEMAQELNFVMIYTVFQVVMSWTFESIIFLFANDKILRVMYKLSFILILVAILFTFTISQESLYMVFVTQAVYALAITFYYMPNEVATMDKNSKGQMRKFIGINSILSLFAKTLSPFLSGVIISYISYPVLFSIISCVAVVCFILSFKVQRLCEVDKRVKFKDFCKELSSYKGIKIGYVGYGIYKFSQDGVIDVIFPVLIFMRTGESFSVGLYAALATLLGGVALIVYLYFFKNKPIAMYICTGFLVAASALMIIVNSIVVFFIYYFIKKIAFEILRNGIFESLFNLPKGTKMEDYKIEQHYAFTIFNKFFVIMAYVFALIIYNFMKNDIAISIILFFLSACQILSTYMVLKSDKLREKNL